MSNEANLTRDDHTQIGPDEILITLTEAAKALPKINGRRPAVCPLWR